MLETEHERQLLQKTRGITYRQIGAGASQGEAVAEVTTTDHAETNPETQKEER